MAAVPVLTAVTDPRREAALVAGLSGSNGAVQVVRRCVDVADLLATAAAGVARAALVSSDLRRLDREAVTRLAVAGVAIVGVAGDDDAARRLHQLGIRRVVGADAAVGDVVSAVLAAIADRPSGGSHDFADPGAVPVAGTPGLSGTRDDENEAAGRVVAVWGPTGAPGRTTVAVELASELAELGVDTLLVDADVYGGVVAQQLGVLDESAGLAAASRLANNGTLDRESLSRHLLGVRPRLRVLTGISRAARWPELRPSAVDAVLALARACAEVTVVDCGFCLERDEELSFDTAAPRRNGATLAVLDVADVVVGVAAGDPVGLQRYVRSLAELAEVLPSVHPLTVVNKLRASAVGGGDARGQVAAALARYAGVQDVLFVPLDVDGFDACLAAGKTLAEAAPKSPARVALAQLAVTCAPRPVAATGRRRFALSRG